MNQQQRRDIAAYKKKVIIDNQLRQIKSLDGRDTYITTDGTKKKWAWNNTLMEFVPIIELEELEMMI